LIQKYFGDDGRKGLNWESRTKIRALWSYCWTLLILGYMSWEGRYFGWIKIPIWTHSGAGTSQGQCWPISQSHQLKRDFFVSGKNWEKPVFLVFPKKKLRHFGSIIKWSLRSGRPLPSKSVKRLTSTWIYLWYMETISGTIKPSKFRLPAFSSLIFIWHVPGQQRFSIIFKF